MKSTSTKTQDVVRLALLARDGDREAAGHLIHHVGALVRWLVNRHAGTSDAEERQCRYQEASLALLGSLKNYTPRDCAFQTFLTRVVIDECKDMLRRSLAQKRTVPSGVTIISVDDPLSFEEVGLTIADTIADPNPGPEEIVINKLLTQAIFHRAFEHCYSKEERLILDAISRDRSDGEIADELGMSRRSANQKKLALLSRIRMNLEREGLSPNV